MKLEKNVAKRSRGHTVYRTLDGTRVPSVTTILGVINKPALIPWANRLGLEGIDSTKYVDGTARIGTLAHQMIQEHLGGDSWDRNDWTPDEISSAENAVISFYNWEGEIGTPIKTLAIEMQMVSETYKFGGTLDWLAEIDNKTWLIDLKTSKSVYPEHIYQLSAYWKTLEDLNFTIDGVRILRVGRTEDEGFDDLVIPSKHLIAGWDVFESALNLYRSINSFDKARRG